MKQNNRPRLKVFIILIAILLLFSGTLIGPTDREVQAGSATIVINEVIISVTGTDDIEFVELFGAPGTDYSTLTVLVLEGDVTTNQGVIDDVLSVGTTDGNGYWTTGFLTAVFENGTETFLLVEGFTGAQNDDLDTNDDGTLNITPWTQLVDSVGFTDGEAGDLVYSTSSVGPDGAPGTEPAGGSRIPNGVDTDSSADWTMSDRDRAGAPGNPGGTALPGYAYITHGAPNSITPPPPTDTPVPPTDTPDVPTDTPVPPTDTPVPPTDTPDVPTDTPVPPTDTPEPITLVASAQCVGSNLEITISAGDANFDILADTAPPGATPFSDVPLGVYTSNGPGTWTNVRVVELSGDNEISILGDFTCTVETDTPVPPTDTPDPGPFALVVSTACSGANLDVTISAGDGPFNITASAGVNTPVLGVGIGTTTINGPEKWDNLTVTETTDDFESINLGQLRCRSDERPVPVTPAHRSRTTNTFPQFSWTSITNANNYRVFVFDDADPVDRTVDIRQNSGGPTSMMLSVPLPNGRLFWRARGRQNRIWSLWSIRFTLFKDPAPPLAVPTPVPTINLGPPSPSDLTGPSAAPTFPAPPNSR